MKIPFIDLSRMDQALQDRFKKFANARKLSQNVLSLLLNAWLEEKEVM